MPRYETRKHPRIEGYWKVYDNNNESYSWNEFDDENTCDQFVQKINDETNSMTTTVTNRYKGE